ncbi:MAG: tyrosine-type recombinase/integrase [Candidatus Saccharimonadales bacterium]
MSNFLSVIGTPTLFDDMDIADSTKQDYLARLPQFAGFLHRNGINRNSLLEYKKYLRSRSDLGIAAKNKYLAVARIALKELYRRGAVSVDLSLNVKSFQQSQKHRVEGLAEQEVERLCQHLRELPDSFQTVRLRALVALLLYQGLRQIEICRLDVVDVRLNTKQLLVLGKARDDKEPIYLHPQTVKALKSYLQASKVKDGPLFTSLWGQTKGERLSTRGLRQIIKTSLNNLGIDKTVHGFRHYYTTTLIKSYKGELLRVAKYTRHSSTDMLMVYNDSLIDSNDLPKYYQAFGAVISR